MAYCQRTDIEQEFSNEELARLTGDSSGIAIDTGRIDLGIERAVAIIDAYLSARLIEQLDELSEPLLKYIAVTLSISALYEIEYNVMAIPESIMTRKREAYKLLKMLKNGELTLNILKHTENGPPFIISNKDQNDIIFDKNILNIYREIR
jgi:phage gp36-like protein